MNKPEADRKDSRGFSLTICGCGSLNGDKAAIGRTLRIQGHSYTVIGIMPRGFQFPFETPATEMYVTFAEDAATADGTKPNTEQRGNHMLLAFGRLKPGVNVAQAEADLRTIAAALEKQYPDTNTQFGAAVAPLRDELIGDVRTALYVLFGAVVCVLLIANANVANLMLAPRFRARKNIALRAALGASRRRIIRQYSGKFVACRDRRLARSVHREVYRN